MPKGLRVQVPPRAPPALPMLSLRRLIIQNREKGESGRISPNELEDAALTERELNRAPGINLSGKNQSVQNPVDSLCPGNSRLEIGQQRNDIYLCRHFKQGALRDPWPKLKVWC